MNCRDCALHHTSGVNCMSGAGPETAEVMIVGEAPGYHEEQQGKPFVGDTGWLLDNDLIPLLGKRRDEVFITNTCRCRPPDNRTPATEEIEACRRHLYAEIERIQPKLVILLGAPAMFSALGIQGIEKFRGQFYQNPRNANVTFIGTYHPAILWRAWERAPIIRADFMKAADFLTGQNRYAQDLSPNTKVTVCDTIEKIQLCADKMTKAGVISFDTETTSLNHQEARVLCVSFSCKQGEAWVIPLRGQYQEQVWAGTDYPTVLLAIEHILNGQAQKVMQHGVFDTLISWQQGWSIRNFTFDTMLAAHLVDENLPVDLDTLVSLHTTMPQYSRVLNSEWEAAKKLYKACKRKGSTLAEKERVLTAGENYSLIDPQVLWQYSGQDADATLRCCHILQHRLQQQNLAELFNSLVMPMTQVVAKLQWNGILVDKPEMVKLHDAAEIEANKIRAVVIDSLQRKTGTDLSNLNIGSTKQLREVLVDALKWPVVKKTDKGNPSFDEDAMTVYKDQHRKVEASMILDHRSHQKQIDTFLLGRDRESGIAKHIHQDGRVHPSFKLHGTRTGRLSAANPAIHNISREGGLRGCYIPPPGWWWLEADYSQLELRILMLLSKDPQLTRWFAEGLDVHQMVAAEVLGIAPDQVTDEQRVTHGKGINFGIIYGMREWSLAEDIGVSVDEAREYLDRYFERLPGVKPFFDGVLNEVYYKGYLVNAFGRVRHFHGAQLYSQDRIAALNPGEELLKRLGQKVRDIDRQAMNFHMQSDGSEIINAACIRIDQQIQQLRSYLNLHHHDALHFCVEPDEILTVARAVKQQMERGVSEFDGYSFPVDLKLCARWYQEDESATKWLKEALG